MANIDQLSTARSERAAANAETALLEQYAEQLRRELALVERQLRGGTASAEIPDRVA